MSSKALRTWPSLPDQKYWDNGRTISPHNLHVQRPLPPADPFVRAAVRAMGCKLMTAERFDLQVACGSADILQAMLAISKVQALDCALQQKVRGAHSTSLSPTELKPINDWLTRKAAGVQHSY